MKMNKTADLLLIAVFSLALALPGAMLVLGPSSDVSTAEKRKLAPFPEVSFAADAILGFPARFEGYFNDHFGGRDILIRLHHSLKARWLKTSPVPDKVLLGKDGWLFYAVNRTHDSLRGLNPLSSSELTAMRQNLEYRRNLLARMGIRYLLVIAPNKQSIYPEYLPDVMRRGFGPNRLDQLVDFLRQTSQVPLLDIRETLRPAKDNGLLYLTKDTHWNQRGAFLAYRGVMRALSGWFPDLAALNDEEVTVSMAASVRGDLAEMLCLKDVWREEAPFVRVNDPAASPDDEINAYLKRFDARYQVDYHRPTAWRNGKASRTAFVFRDSFFTDIIPFMSENFGRIVYFYEPFNAELFLQLAREKMKPDVVVEEIIEREL